MEIKQNARITVLTFAVNDVFEDGFILLDGRQIQLRLVTCEKLLNLCSVIELHQCTCSGEMLCCYLESHKTRGVAAQFRARVPTPEVGLRQQGFSSLAGQESRCKVSYPSTRTPDFQERKDVIKNGSFSGCTYAPHEREDDESLEVTGFHRTLVFSAWNQPLQQVTSLMKKNHNEDSAFYEQLMWAFGFHLSLLDNVNNSFIPHTCMICILCNTSIFALRL